MIPATQEPVPADFVEVATGKTIADMRLHYRRAFRTVKRWFAESGVEVAKQVNQGRAIRQMPEGFREASVGVSIAVLMKRYGARRDSVRRWIAETGQVRLPGNTKPPRQKVAKVPRQPRIAFERASVEVKPRILNPSRKPGNPGIVNRVERDMSAAGQAADVLRRDRWVVFRANESRRPDASGKFWVCGKALVTSAELIERAERAERRMAA